MKEHVFVVRIWREYREVEEKEPRFRGMVQHMATGEKQYFNDVSRIATFLATHLNLSEESSVGQAQQLTEHREEGFEQSSTHSPHETGAEDGSA